MMKRKLGEVGEVAASEPMPTRHKKEKFRDATWKKIHVEPQNDINGAISKMDSRLLPDYIAQRNQRFGEQLRTVDLEDTRVPGNVGRRLHPKD